MTSAWPLEPLLPTAAATFEPARGAFGMRGFPFQDSVTCVSNRQESGALAERTGPACTASQRGLPESRRPAAPSGRAAASDRAA